MALKKSETEQRGDVLLRVMQRGKASLRETAIVLGKSWPTIKAHVDLGKIQTIRIGQREYVTLKSLVEDHGLVLPFLPDFSERVKQHLMGIDTNDVNDDLGDDYD